MDSVQERVNKDAKLHRDLNIQIIYMCLVELQPYVWVSDAHFLAAERSKCLVNLSHVELCGFLEVKVKVIIITIVIARPDIRLCVRV